MESHPNLCACFLFRSCASRFKMWSFNLLYMPIPVWSKQSSFEGFDLEISSAFSKDVLYYFTYIVNKICHDG